MEQNDAVLADLQRYENQLQTQVAAREVALRAAIAECEFSKAQAERPEKEIIAMQERIDLADRLLAGAAVDRRAMKRPVDLDEQVRALEQRREGLREALEPAYSAHQALQSLSASATRALDALRAHHASLQARNTKLSAENSRLADDVSAAAPLR